MILGSGVGVVTKPYPGPRNDRTPPGHAPLRPAAYATHAPAAFLHQSVGHNPAKGTVQAAALLKTLADDEAIPSAAQAMFADMGAPIAALDQRIDALGEQLKALHQASPMGQLLADVPGIAPIGAITAVLTVEPANFASARHFAVWLGLTPKEHSTRASNAWVGSARPTTNGCASC